MVTYFKHSVAPPAISGALRESPALFLAALPTDCIMKSRDCVVITQRHSATEQRLPQGRKESVEGRLGAGGARREEVKEGRKEAAGGEWDVASVDFPSIFFFFRVTQSQVPVFEERKIIHITQFWFHLFPLSVSVCGLKGSDLCQGINWAKMRLNHKCKVASAATRLCSLVAYQPSLCRHPVTLCLFGVLPPWSAALSARASRKHRRWDEVVIWVWGLYITTLDSQPWN